MYEDLRVLEATWRVLRERSQLAIPEMNRSLVEATTHRHALERIVEELGGPWKRHQQWVLGQFYSDRRHGELQLVRRDQEFGHYSFPSKEISGRAQTRLGEGDRLLELQQPVPAAFGGSFQQMTVPAYLAQGISAEAHPKVVSGTHEQLRLDWDGRRFGYGRLGFQQIEDDEREV